MPEWDPDARIEELSAELIMDDNDEAKAAKRIFRENAVMAAHSICHLAVYSPNERLRLDASKYVVERVIGRLNDVNPDEDKDGWNAFLADVVTNDAPNT